MWNRDMPKDMVNHSYITVLKPDLLAIQCDRPTNFCKKPINKSYNTQQDKSF